MENEDQSELMEEISKATRNTLLHLIKINPPVKVGTAIDEIMDEMDYTMQDAKSKVQFDKVLILTKTEIERLRLYGNEQKYLRDHLTFALFECLRIKNRG